MIYTIYKIYGKTESRTFSEIFDEMNEGKLELDPVEDYDNIEEAENNLELLKPCVDENGNIVVFWMTEYDGFDETQISTKMPEGFSE